MNNFTGRQIAIFTDSHGLLEPTVAILEDIRRRGITEIYSLGDAIGVGPNPSEVLDVLDEYGVQQINGNSEEYSAIGIEPFMGYFDSRKIKSQDWTYSQLRPDQIRELQQNEHSFDLRVGVKKIGLCHFANDVRIDFGANSTWSYQASINRGIGNPNEQFYYTNSPEQTAIIERFASRGKLEDAGFASARRDRLFDGKRVDFYDEIIQGHVHFKFLTEDAKTRIRTIRGAGIGYGINDPIDFASYIIIREREVGYDVEEVLVAYDRSTMIRSIQRSDMPDKESITRFISKRR